MWESQENSPFSCSPGLKGTEKLCPPYNSTGVENTIRENQSETEEEGGGREYTSAVFHSGAHMLLGTHPIPARSPAEREGA